MPPIHASYCKSLCAIQTTCRQRQQNKSRCDKKQRVCLQLTPVIVNRCVLSKLRAGSDSKINQDGDRRGDTLQPKPPLASLLQLHYPLSSPDSCLLQEYTVGPPEYTTNKASWWQRRLVATQVCGKDSWPLCVHSCIRLSVLL
jgi:hypothetical protein